MEEERELFKVSAVPGRQEIDTEMVVDAPASLVYRAFTEPELVAQWLGPRNYDIIIEELDVRFGGAWRFIHRGPDGEYPFKGVFHQVSPNRIVRTFEWEGMPGHISLESVDFVERDGKTYIYEKAVYLSMEDRDGMLEGGMEEGVRDSYERLVELLGRLKLDRVA